MGSQRGGHDWSNLPHTHRAIILLHKISSKSVRKIDATNRKCAMNTSRQFSKERSLNANKHD